MTWYYAGLDATTTGAPWPLKCGCSTNERASYRREPQLTGYGGAHSSISSLAEGIFCQAGGPFAGHLDHTPSRIPTHFELVYSTRGWMVAVANRSGSATSTAYDRGLKFDLIVHFAVA